VVFALRVPVRFPSLNELLAAAGKRHGRWSAYAEMKRNTEAAVVLCLRTARIAPVKVPVVMHYLLVEENRRRDPSNVASVVVKVVEDALQRAGVLENDGWKQILGIRLSWEKGERSEVLVGATRGSGV